MTINGTAMDSFLLAFNVVFPLFLMMALGYFLRRVKLFNDDFLKQLNKVSFKVFLPLILFMNVYDSNFAESFQPKLLIFAVICVIAIFAIMTLIVPIFEKNNMRRGVLIQGMARSNYILFGLPIAVSLFGSSDIGVTAVLIAFIIPLYNLLSVIVLSVFRGGKVDIKRLVIDIVTNPLILGALVAFVFALTGLKLPHILEQTVRDISKIATPLALIILGGSFYFTKLKPNILRLSLAVIVKLIVIPLCVLPIAIALGFRGVELGSLLAMLASPTAVSSFTMAQQMQGDDELAGQIVVSTSLCSVLTIFAWVMILSACGVLL